MNRFIKRVAWCISLTIVGILLCAEGLQGETASSQAAPPSMADIDRLLSGARQAMSQGEFSKAESLLTVAESAKPKYPVLHFGDTPARVRRDLEKMNKNRGAAASTTIAKSTKQIANPFTDKAKENAAAETTTNQPAVALSATPLASPNNRKQSDQALLSARQALVVGDVATARKQLEKAQTLKVQYGESEDSPEKVAQSLAKLLQLTTNGDYSASWKQSYAKFLVAEGKVLLNWGDIDSAERAASEAADLVASIGIEDSGPGQLLKLVGQARQKSSSISKANAPQPLPVVPATTREAIAPINTPANRLILDKSVAPAAVAVPIDLTLPNFDEEPTVPRLAQLPAAGEISAALSAEGTPETLPPGTSDTFTLLEAGEAALRAGDRSEALKLFRTAFERRNELDVVTQQRLQDHLQMLAVGNAQGRTPPNSAAAGSLIDAASDSQAVIARQLSADVGKHQTEAAALRETEPRRSLEILQEAITLIGKSELDDNTKTQLTRRVELSISETQQYLKDHEADIELDEANAAALGDVERQRAVKEQVRDKMAKLVDQFNELVHEHRYAEAERIAKELYELAPEEPVAQQVWENAKFIRREMLNEEIEHLTEDGFVKTQLDIRLSAAEGLVGASEPIQFADNWEEISKLRGRRDPNANRSQRELEIEHKLSTPVMPNYTDMPLSEVIDSLAKLAGINIHLDSRGLGQEGVQVDTPVTLNLGSEVRLDSALNLILEPLHLTYMIKDEVLKITSEQIRDGELITIPYNVADLVIPIPNFVPTNNMGLQGLINDAYDALPFSNGARQSGPVSMVPTAPPGQQAGEMPAGAMAQQFGASNAPGSSSVPMGGGPGGLGAAANADFDSLIDLIVSTVEYDSWMENGSGEGEIQEFATNLSLVISQTQRVHDQIRDLLEQLRRLQDLQVTIEVRFIRLTDSFFERIGIDFDFNIEDGSGIAAGSISDTATFEPRRGSATVGVTSPTTGIGDPLPSFSVDLDVPFRNSSFGLATPQFGNAQTVGEFGFAILSDIEAFFLINASQGDSRANVLQAPKVTLFNGQQGIVADTALRPFVISVIPVVGEFAAAQQPVIVVLSEGTLLTVQAVVSDDRRYVRLTLVPFFSQIGDVDTFTFEGSETTSSSSNTTDDDEDGNDESSDVADTITRTGTTVQLPTFQVITVATTVSVPDGGTVLLGGVKRLREGRNEFGVPLLSKVPYVDRLFRNVGIGRETDSLMMMVTPHIIIQEEEEARLGITQD